MALMFVRLFRRLAWAGATAFALYRAWALNSTIVRIEASAFQEASLIGFCLVDLAVAYIVVRSLDVGLELQERGMLERR